MKKTLLLLAFLGLCFGGFAQTKAIQRIALVNLQRGNVVESSRAGQIGLTDGDGNQRYAQYTEVDLVPIGYTPTPTGNTQNYSEFVTTVGGDIYYIDWQGRSVKLFAAAAAGDYDWLEISNNQIPNSIRDSIYTDNYASVNVRYVWPSAQFLAGDSTTVGNIVVLGNRESRMGFYRLTGPAWSSIGQEGGSLTARLGTGTSTFIVQSAGGASSSQPSGPYRNILVVGTDSTIQMHDYPRTRNDTATAVNFLYTDAIGVLRSSPISELPSGGGGIDSIVTTIRLTGKGTDVDPLDISAPIFENSHVVEFKRPTVYGSEFEPVTWPNITLNNTDAVLQTQLMIHNNASTAPTFPNTCAVSGTYKLGFNNYIRFTRVSPIFFVVNINE